MKYIISNIIDGFKTFPSSTRYILLGSIVIAIIVLIPRIFYKIKKLKEIFSNKKYRQNPNSSHLSEIQQRALNIGAINAEQTMFYIDSLTTGIPKLSLRDSLLDYYGIQSSDSAKETLEWLLNEGHRIYFDIIKHHINTDNIKNITMNLPKEIDKNKLIEYHKNLKDSIDHLINNRNISSNKDLEYMSILAWDMGRLVVVSRSCYDCQYITEIEAWNIIQKALEICKDAYTDWSDFATGYVVGRCMWSGFNTWASGIMAIAQDLIQDKDSPWQKITLK